VKFEYSPALGLAVIAVVIIAAAVTLLAVADDNGGRDETPAGVTALGASGDDHPAAPWRTAAAVPRAAVPAAWLEAWDRAANHATCALLHPAGGGPELQDAQATSSPTPEDKGWDIFLTGPAGSVEVLALFDKATQTNRPPVTPSFTRTWADGSVAKYAPDVGTARPGTYDPDASPFEAVLTLPDQSCAYRIYDTLGRAHLESVFDRLRLLAP
jgi:hypothetical protein